MKSHPSNALARICYRRALAGLLLLGCGGALTGPTTGGESHFLTLCETSCDGGFDCISGVCTRGCLVKDASCSDLSESALCTDLSVEPGAVAVCDVSCADDSACAELGSQHRCQNGFCRRPTPPGGVAAKSCQVAKIVYPSGSMNIPEPNGCGTCACTDGSLVCTDPACPNGVPVFECPTTVATDPITVINSELVASTLTLEVAHAGGCQTHDYALCYGPGFLESSPVQVGLQLIHDAHGDSCEAYLSKTIAFDLSRLGEAYNRMYGTPGGIIKTPYGLYAFGDSSCQDRTQAAIEQALVATENAGGPCSTGADCQIAYRATRCSPGCESPIATSKAEHFQSVLTAIDTNVCGNFAEKGCAIAVPPCLSPPAADCVEGRCVLAAP